MKPRAKPAVKWNGPVRTVIAQKRPVRASSLKRESKTRAKENRAYSKARKVFLAENWQCQIRTAHCEGRAMDVHHRAGRGKNLLAVDTFVATCRNCHNYVHRHPNRAREEGWLK